MAATCMSLMGSKKTSSIAAIGVLVVLMGLCHVREADAAAIAVINLSLVPINVTATVNASVLGSVVVGVSANVSLPLLPLNTSTNALVNLTITNLLDHASVSTLVSANATTALLITPTSLLSLTRVNVALGNLLGLVFSLIRTIVTSL